MITSPLPSIWRPAIYGAPAIPAITKAAAQQSSTAVDGTSFSSSSMTIASDERALIGVWARAASNITISNLTLNAGAVTQLVKFETSTGTPMGFFLGPVGVGGVVAVTFSGTMARAGCAVWPVKNVAIASAYDSEVSEVAQAAAMTLNIPAGGIGVGMAYNSGTAGPAIAWTNLTEDTEVAVETTNTISYASDLFASAQSNLAVTATLTGTANAWRAACVSLR